MNDEFQKRLRARAKVWASQISRKANVAQGKPKHIRVSSTVETRNGMINIVSTAVSPKGDARAYEYGSGIHARRSIASRHQLGAKGFIRIYPKNKKVLAFFWDKVNSSTPSGKKFVGISATTGKALLRYVDHPGVEAANNGKGYLAPAVNEVRKQIRKEIPVEVRKEVIGTIKRAFKQK